MADTIESLQAQVAALEADYDDLMESATAYRSKLSIAVAALEAVDHAFKMNELHDEDDDDDEPQEAWTAAFRSVRAALQRIKGTP